MSIKRVTLTINSIQREILCNPEKDSLAKVLRQMGLTGTKSSCNSGHCGACSLILNGKLVRSCIYMMQRVPDFSVIETIEGLGTPDNLHPLQQAFLTYAAVQCGFCSPGFILSAKALLNQNTKPTRQEVRDWFTKHNNVCRCTGYKPIVDAVMAAAAVMCGDAEASSLLPQLPEDGQIYGTNFTKPLGVTRVLGTCDFGADIALKMPTESWQLAVVIAGKHSAKITHIDTTKAQNMPGVKAIITAKDVRGTNRLNVAQGSVHSLCHGKDRPVFCEDIVYRYGDIVAVVAAKSKEEARAAAAEVTVDYTDLPAIMNFIDAAKPHAKQVHHDIPNIFIEQPLYKGDSPRDILENSTHCVHGAFSTTRQPHLSIEPDVVQAYPHGEGVAIQCKTQFIYGIAGQIAAAIGVDSAHIRVIGNPAGGSFGYSMSAANYAVAAVCALALNAPVSLELSYAEHQHITGKRSPIHANARLACDVTGKLQAMDYLVGLDHGAYSEMAGALTAKAVRFFGYYYAIPHIRGLVRTAFTNANFGTAYRAFGSPQAFFVSEQLIDMLALQMGEDPFEFRYKNLVKEGELSTTSVPYHEYPIPALMDILRPHYEAAKERARACSTDTVKHGVGLALGGYHVSKLPDRAEVNLELLSDNTVAVYSTWADVGQGADFGLMAHVHQSLRPLNLTQAQIHLISNDSALCPDTGSASGSRSHHAAGLAIINAAEQMLAAMRKSDGGFRTYEEMQADNIPTLFKGIYTDNWPDIDPDTGHGYGCVAQNYMVFLTEVAVDITSGKTTVLEAHIAADVGNIGSQHAVLGQAWGGFAHSVGYALSENYEDMQKHASLRGAGVGRCNDIPDNIHVHFHTSVRKNGPHGSTGCSEGFQSSGHVAIINAIANATNIRITTLPATPEKVKAALEVQNQGKNLEQNMWDLGCDLYERLDYLAHVNRKLK